MKLSLLITIFTPFLGLLTPHIHAEGTTSYHAAGVLPYAIDGTGRVKILLGASSVHKNQLSDFGGLRDEIDGYSPQRTAAREGCEELMFIFDGERAFKKIVSLRNTFKKKFDITKARSRSYKRLRNAMFHACPRVTNSGYIMHFIQIPYDETISTTFDKRKGLYQTLVPKCWNETVALVWVDLDDLLSAIHATAEPKLPIIAGFKLYKPFVQSLVAAYKNSVIPYGPFVVTTSH